MKAMTTMPKGTVAELLRYIAEHEGFSSVTRDLAGGFTVQEVRAVFRELANELSREAAEECATEFHTAAHGMGVSSQAQDIVASLPAEEQQKLLATFGFGTL
jgi:hypothetical protein